MPKPPSNEKKSAAAPALTRYQKFTAETIDRGLIRNAPYNPRTIDAHARKKLREKIKSAGLVETLVWNKRTGNLVGGHQRLAIIDDLEGRKDYRLTVAVIDVDEKQERELNVFLNNTSAMGNWDLDALGAIIPTVELDNLGFDLVDLELMFDDPNVARLLNDQQETPEAKTTLEDIQQIKADKKKRREADKQRNDAEFYCVLVFGSRAEVDEFLTKAKQPTDCRYVDGRKVAAELGMELSTAPASPEPQPAQPT